MESESAWNNGQKDVLKQHGDQWAEILSGPPYNATP